MHTTTSWRLGIATLSLSAAMAVYSLARIHPPAMLESIQLTLPALAAQTALFGSLPSLFYTLAIGLLIGTCASTAYSARLHCSLWLGIALMLEKQSFRSIEIPAAQNWSQASARDRRQIIPSLLGRMTSTVRSFGTPTLFLYSGTIL